MGDTTRVRVLLVGTYQDHVPSPLNPGKLSPGLVALEAWLGEYARPRPDVHVRVYHVGALGRAGWVGDLLEIGPHILGLSCTFWSIDALLVLARGARRLVNPPPLVVLGGPQVSSLRHAERILSQHPEVDLVVRGEGEKSLAAVVEAVGRGIDPGLAAGTSCRRAGGVVHNPEPGPVEPLDSIPSPYREDNLERLLSMVSHGQVSYQTFRGCTQRCIYCAYHAGGLRLHGMDRVSSDLAFILGRMRPRFLRIIDARLGPDRSRALEILAVVAAHNGGTEVQVFHDVRHVDRAYLEACDRAGALRGRTAQEFGLQSACPEVLAAAGRRPDTDAFAGAMDAMSTYCGERGIPFHATAEYMIGLPGDTYERFLDTLVFALGSGARHVRSFPLLVFPGSEIHERAGDLGIEHLDEGSYRALATPTFDSGRLQRAIHLARLVEAIDASLARTFEVLRTARTDLAPLLEAILDRYLDRTRDRDPESFENRALVSAVRSAAGGAEPTVRRALIDALRADAEEIRIPL